ncbi:receptor-type tyrosine-protein phosphatase U-like [Centruroides sculpturatus]|uniref:receptor-type tyrosine-protein phosphatase U-like n=1 Tax=Centruroides sculpturatus TaxID=218467 RepID=UPI000C6D394E|nr:receptor-type tyrosine-protein phosphatase U-like [Centruroides sculpturatus]
MAQAPGAIVKWNEATIINPLSSPSLALTAEKLQIYRSRLQEGCLNARDAESLPSAWKFMINITAVKSFNETVSGTSQFNIVNATQRQYAFEDLYPATLYNVSIEASTSAGYGSPLNVQFTTNHSVPIIEVEPAVLEVTDSTIGLLIKPIKFDKGPISEYHVIVERKGRLKKREIKIEEKELINYNTSVNTSINYYSTARFYPRQLHSEGINFTVGDGKTYNDFYNAPLITGENYQLGMAVLSNYNGKILIGYKYLSDVIKVERLMSKGTDKSSLIDDEARVVSQICGNGSHSDYINANYVDKISRYIDD